MNMNLRKLLNFALREQMPGFFPKPKVLNSRRTSHWYFNARPGTDTVGKKNEFVQLISYALPDDFPSSTEFDFFYGVPDGATKIGLGLTELYVKNKFWTEDAPLVQGRKKAKTGQGASRDAYFVGVPEERAVIVEDVTTTGKSLDETVESFGDMGIKVVATLGIMNRDEKRDDGLSVGEFIAEKYGITHFSLLHANDVLQAAVKRFKPTKTAINHVNKEYRQYGVEEYKVEKL